jgi:hypothetical protein
MPSLDLYDVIIPTFINGLKTLDFILSKAEEYAKENGIDAEDFPSSTLIADQLPLKFQIQNATRIAANMGARLGGIELLVFENTEETMADLHGRIQTSLALLEKVDSAVTPAHEDDELEL